ncbi:unnamed protein product [Acanthoscelides obtectus]|uniref:Disintegrin and metalloproteinase domain-containing protein 10-like n=1 Tax=Acanthoscelides obtectus TaxID=200917 RepID=A0A9P0L981_ACAOB|nr:unnamed protein product [Acanthoscelides obtectus]CAK1624669.1 Disintegrin and metalloproteinase domain-containing protein 10 [Acanthoscelides obtectus]
MLVLKFFLFISSILTNRVVIACFKINQADLFSENYVISSSKIPTIDLATIGDTLRSGTFTFGVCPEEVVCLEVHLGMKKISILDQDLHIDLFSKAGTNKLRLDKVKPIFVEGYAHGLDGENHVFGYIEDNFFYGQIMTSDNIYYIDDIRGYFPRESINMSRYNAVVFKRKRYNAGTNEKLFLKETKNIVRRFAGDWSEDGSNPYIDPDVRYMEFLKTGKVCTLFVLMDKSFLNILHDDDIKSAVTNILQNIDQVDSIFRSTDFNNDGVPDNIGFKVKHLAVLVSEDSPVNLIPPYTNIPMAGPDYLIRFTNYEILRDVCLGVAFTAQSFQNNTLGVSYTALKPVFYHNVFKLPVGGICDRPTFTDADAHLNVLVISSRLPNGKTVHPRLSTLSLAHELGHSFGAPHDTQECKGYLMGSHTPEKEERKNYIFSECSKPHIVQTILNQGYCLEDSEEAFCGNGIVEQGETCDCGTWRDCAELDVCCIPRGEKHQCQVNWLKQYQCHPSQGLCCTQRCVYKDLIQYGVNCKRFEKACPCPPGEKCTCGVDSECIDDTCHSLECTRMNLEECKCPYTDVNTNEDNKFSKCHTCCSFEGNCESSSTVVHTIVSRKEDITAYLKQNYTFKKFPRSVRIKKFGHYKEFCNQAGGINSSCTLLFFREVIEKDYCILFGKVGTCRKSGCDVPGIRQIYPVIIKARSISGSTNRSVEFSITSYIFLLLGTTCQIILDLYQK